MRMIFAAVVALVATSCSSLPTTEKVNAFGQSAEATATVVKASIQAHQTLAVRIGEEEQAERLLATRSIVTLDVEPGTTLPDQQVGLRAQAAGALQQYAAALAAASDRKTVNALETASASLGLAVSAAATTAFPISAPVIGPALKVTSRVVGLGLGNAYAGEIQAIIRARDADVTQLSQMLAKDMATIAEHLSAQELIYSETRRKVLNRIAGDYAVDRLRLYDEYKQARADVNAIATLAAAAKRAPAVLKTMAKAHHELAVGSPDATETLRQFLAMTDDLSALVTAIVKSGGA